MRRMRLFPFTTFSQKVFKSFPIGVTKPIPVTTTRRLLIGSGVRSYFALFFWTPEILSISRAHTDHLSLLKELPFGTDGRSNDNFGLLEFAEIGCANVPHAGGNCADEVLTSVINFGRSEQDLLQRSGCSHSNSSSSRQVGMGGSHTPMISFTRCFDRFGKGTTYHYRIRATRECLTDVASFAHTTIGNDWYIFTALLKMVIARGGAIDCSRYLGNT